ncbi:NAD(P)H-binding protein, partial [Lysinibacillus sp. BF-4]|uniref:NAD(P)H-binding protein n=1 Tax=Lysinibacillus sp. BF-4 TaxID=1473546 RepID=UPI000564BB69
MKLRSAIVVGATGLVGSELVKQLCACDEYVSVTVIVRKKIDFTHDKLMVKVRDFDRLEERDIDFAHEVYCCLGTTIKKAGSRQAFEKVDFSYPLHIASLAKKKGIPHFIVITAMNANAKSFVYYSRVKGMLERDLIELDLPQLSIVRPSLLTGAREEFRFGERVGAVMLALLRPVLVGPLKRFKSIEARQVAQAMLCIALYEKKQKVAIYQSHQLQQLQPPAVHEQEEEIIFNWKERE